MLDDPISPWQPVITTALRKFAANRRADHEDLRQECCLALLPVLPRIQQIAAHSADEARAFVFQVCRNKILNTLTAAAHLTDESNLSDEEARRLPALPGLEDVERRADLQHALEKLAPVERFVINGLFYEGSTREELAVTCGQPTRWVDRTKVAALLKLKTLLG